MAFKDILNDTKESLVKGNQSNLAHAYLYVEESIQEHLKMVEKLQRLKAEIEEAGDSPEVLNDASGAVTKELYERAMKMSR